MFLGILVWGKMSTVFRVVGLRSMRCRLRSPATLKPPGCEEAQANSVEKLCGAWRGTGMERKEGGREESRQSPAILAEAPDMLRRCHFRRPIQWNLRMTHTPATSHYNCMRGLVRDLPS